MSNCVEKGDLYCDHPEGEECETDKLLHPITPTPVEECCKMTQPTIEELQEKLVEYEAIFDMMWKANMKAIQLWKKHHPGTDLVWPDMTKMMDWYVGQLTEPEA